MVVAKRKRRKRAASEKPKKPSIKEWREMRREAWRNRPNKSSSIYTISGGLPSLGKRR